MNLLIKDTFVKHTLGKIFIFLIITTLVHTEDFSYHLTATKSSLYVKEPLLINFEVKQTNPNIVLLFNFDLKKSQNYYFQRVGQEESDKYHDISIKYTYIIYPLKAGEININFHLIKKITSDDKVAYSFSGDRDNVKGLVTTDFVINVPPLTLKVTPLPQGTQIVGDFSLKYKLPKKEAKPYEPLSFKIWINGIGYPPIIDDFFVKKHLFKLFKEIPQNKKEVTKKGIKNAMIYPMALSHTKDFTLPKIQINVFNPLTKKSYLLTVPSHTMIIRKEAKEILLDKVDSPQPFQIDWRWITQFLEYLIVFVAGYFTHILLKWKKQTQKKTVMEVNPLKEKIIKTKEEKALLQLLISSQSKGFQEQIDRLEKAIYHQHPINFKQLKKEILEKLK